MLDFDQMTEKAAEISASVPSANFEIEMTPIQRQTLEGHKQWLERQFDQQREMTADWVIKSWHWLYRLEEALIQDPEAMTKEKVEHFLSIATSFEKGAAKIADTASIAVRSFSRTRKKALPVSVELSAYLKKYVARIEAVTDRDLSVSLEIADHFRALARAYDKENKSSAVFDNSDDAIHFLRS